MGKMRSAWFVLINGWFYRKVLLWHSHSQSKRAVTEIDCLSLCDEGVEVLVLDFDGVLVAHGKNAVDRTDVDRWLRQAISVFGDRRVFILSNNPSIERKLSLESQYPGVVFVVPARKKPFTDGLEWVRGETGACYQRMLMIDDRLLTGVLSAVLHQSRAVYITEPYADFDHSWIYEIGMRAVRKIERFIVSV